MSKYKVYAEIPGRPTVYECKDEDELRDIMWLVGINEGTITWIGEKVILGKTPNGLYDMYEYREIKEAYK